MGSPATRLSWQRMPTWRASSGTYWCPRALTLPLAVDTAQAVAINLLLVAMFAVQHSVMARPAFKRLWTRFVPQPIERATYVWMANAATILLMWQWQPIDAVVWDAEQPVVRGMLWSLFAAGWLAVPLVSLMINHFDLFGTRQVWLFWRNKPYTDLPFRTPAAYAHVRHPLYLGWGLLFWAIPTMTVGHLLFAAFANRVHDVGGYRGRARSCRPLRTVVRGLQSAVSRCLCRG